MRLPGCKTLSSVLGALVFVPPAFVVFVAYVFGFHIYEKSICNATSFVEVVPTVPELLLPASDDCVDAPWKSDTGRRWKSRTLNVTESLNILFSAPFFIVIFVDEVTIAAVFESTWVSLPLDGEPPMEKHPVRPSPAEIANIAANAVVAVLFLDFRLYRELT